uniref:Uncharacterized protein n=1 Tax=Rhizophora mucronata TaxID=61149 RepID=A0A2P2MYU4_RHIMU
MIMLFEPSVFVMALAIVFTFKNFKLGLRKLEID